MFGGICEHHLGDKKIMDIKKSVSFTLRELLVFVDDGFGQSNFLFGYDERTKHMDVYVTNV